MKFRLALVILIAAVVISAASWYLLNRQDALNNVTGSMLDDPSAAKTHKEDKESGANLNDNQQGEQDELEDKLSKYIKSLHLAPASFLASIDDQIDFAVEYDECQKQKGNEYFAPGPYYSIIKNVRNEFVAMNMGGCTGGGIGIYYTKQSSEWVLAFRAQQAPTCEKINKFTYTKVIFPECYDEKSGRYVSNTNP